LQAFIDQHHEDAYLVDRLKGEWLVALVRRGDYLRARALEPVLHHNPAIACARLLARHKTGEKIKGEEALNVWAADDLCWHMLEILLQDKVVTWSALHGQLRKLLERNRSQDARRIAELLFTEPQMRDYTALMNNPRQWLKGKKKPANRAQRALTALALARLARSSSASSSRSPKSGSNPNARLVNAIYFEKQWAARLTEADRQWVWGQFALAAVLDGEPQATRWYRYSEHPGKAVKTEFNHAWQVRAELRQTKIDWKRVDAVIVQMTPEQQRQTAWQYWRARALTALNPPQTTQTTQTAKKLFEQTARHDDFYGLLAREELGWPLALPAPPAALSRQDMEEVRANTGLQRALRLFQLGARQEAVPAWNFALRGMSERQLRAAAALAHQAQVFDRVINTALLAQTENDAAQRFVTPFETFVSAAARATDVEAAWIYGLIRQESRFILEARSSAGAAGLMQLMPATARWVAAKIGMKNFRLKKIDDAQTNTLLGTHYLSLVQARFDGSQILATAGYNAGPNRAAQWRERLKAPQEGAVFIETIPFTETRLYVKNVLANTMHYALALGVEPASLKARLGVVAPPAVASPEALALNTDLP